MSRIAEIDANFKTNGSIGKSDVKFRDVREEPFAVYGVYYDDGQFRRLPKAVAEATNEGVLELHAHTAGGRVRFCTDSSYVAIHAEMPLVSKMPHFALTGSAGFDLYETVDGKERYIRTFVPPVDITDGYEGVIELGEGMHEVTVHFPLYSEVSSLYIGLRESATLTAPRPYLPGPPIVYYGSSITQGGCASRPGNAYQNRVTRELWRDHINLGFSGSARAEKAITDYIAGLDMAAFVYDYDHNAPTVEYLRNTHERMFCAIRAAHPELPIVMMARPQYHMNEDAKQRLAVIKQTLHNAQAVGDKNVYLIDGPTLMALAGGEGTVDNCHPNDLGFASMAQAVGRVLRDIL